MNEKKVTFGVTSKGKPMIIHKTEASSQKRRKKMPKNKKERRKKKGG